MCRKKEALDELQEMDEGSGDCRADAGVNQERQRVGVKWISLLVMLSGRGSALRIPTMPPARSARRFRSVVDGAASGGGRGGLSALGGTGSDMIATVNYHSSGSARGTGTWTLVKAIR